MSRMKAALADEIEDIREELGDDCTVERLLEELAAARQTLADRPAPDGPFEESDYGCPICKRPLLRLKAPAIGPSLRGEAAKGVAVDRAAKAGEVKP